MGKIGTLVNNARRKNQLNLLNRKAFEKVIIKLNPNIAYVDAADVNEQRFGREIKANLTNQNDTDVISMHKADSKIPVVAAASIIAKQTRENEIEKLKKKIEEMVIHEKEHADYFENEIKKRGIKPTKFLPLWDLLGVGLGFGSTILGKKAAMLCTASVEEVIDEHYSNQINALENDEKKLRDKIIKFRKDELQHKDIAYKEGATKKGMYSILDKLIKTGSKIAINISEKI